MPSTPPPAPSTGATTTPAGPAGPPIPNHDGTRIFSSPVVVSDKVLFGVDVDGQKNKHGYVAAADLATGRPVWEFQTDVDAAGHVLDDGCGSVWSSGTVLTRLGLVVFDTSDCNFVDTGPLAEAVIALRISDGHLAWTYRPALAAVDCDWDFGATPNAGISPSGTATFLGVGGKNGTYYSLDPATGHIRWSTNVVFGGFAGGFIATTAYDGRHVYGATALGDYGKFEHGTQVLCDPSDRRDTPMQEPSMHAFDATTGDVAWQADHAPSFAATTVAGGMTFSGPALDGNVLQVRDRDHRRAGHDRHHPRANLVGGGHGGRRPGDRHRLVVRGPAGGHRRAHPGWSTAQDRAMKNGPSPRAQRHLVRRGSA